MTTQIRVMRVIARMNVGGPAVQVTGLMKNLEESRLDQLLVCGAVGPGEHDYLEGRDPGFPIHRIESLGRRISANDDLASASRLRQLVKQFRPHIIHTHTAKAGVVGRLPTVSRDVPIRVHTYHGHLLEGYFGALGTRAVVLTERILAHWTTYLLSVGTRVREDLLAAGIGRSDSFGVMPPGIEIPPDGDRSRTRTELGIDQTQPVISIIGRMVQIKRPDRLAEVIQRVNHAVPRLVVVVAGEGDQLDTFRSLAQGVNVRYVGWRSDVENIHAASDLSLQASDNEGTPISLIEAGMAGRPVVATDVGSVSDVVRDGRTGLLRSREAPDLAEAVISLLRDSAWRQDLGQQAKTWTRDEFSAKRLATDHLGLYEELLSRWRPPA